MAVGKVVRDGGWMMDKWKGRPCLRRTFDFDDALLAIHGRMSVCGGGWHMLLGVPLDDGH